MQITFEQPNRPLSINEGNKLHWASRRGRLDPGGVALFVAARQAGGTASTGPIEVRVTLTFPRNARRDPHNYVGTVVKKLVDTLVGLGVVPDDTADWVTVIEPELRVAPDNLATVSIAQRNRT